MHFKNATVIMSCYNSEKYIEECLDSIVHNKKYIYELIVVDDFSNDSTLSILDSYAKRLDFIKIVRNRENLGLTKSLNEALNFVKTELVARIDSDDLMCKDRLRKQIDMFNDDPELDVCFTNVFLIDDRSNCYGSAWLPRNINYIYKILPYHCLIKHPSVMYKKNALSDVGFYDDDFVCGQDHDLWKRLMLSNKKFKCLKESLTYYRINPKSVRSDNNAYYDSLVSYLLANDKKLASLKMFTKVGVTSKIKIILRLFVSQGLYLSTLYFIKGILARNPSASMVSKKAER